MSKKKVIKKASKKPAVEMKNDELTEGQQVLLALVIAAAIALITGLCIFGVPNFITGKSEIKVGQCYLTRDFKFFQVKYNYNALEESELIEMKVYPLSPSSSSIYWLTKDSQSGDYRERTHEFIRANYTQIPCERF